MEVAETPSPGGRSEKHGRTCHRPSIASSCALQSKLRFNSPINMPACFHADLSEELNESLMNNNITNYVHSIPFIPFQNSSECILLEQQQALEHKD